MTVAQAMTKRALDHYGGMLKVVRAQKHYAAVLAALKEQS